LANAPNEKSHFYEQALEFVSKKNRVPTMGGFRGWDILKEANCQYDSEYNSFSKIDDKGFEIW
jgi:hypothetical protein